VPDLPVLARWVAPVIFWVLLGVALPARAQQVEAPSELPPPSSPLSEINASNVVPLRLTPSRFDQN
jgi:hypothetical protein